MRPASGAEITGPVVAQTVHDLEQTECVFTLCLFDVQVIFVSVCITHYNL